MGKEKIHVIGMHGLGDNIHQRAIIRKLVEQYDVWLETSWPSIYHDFPEVKFIRKSVKLRTQTKNAERERHLYVPHHVQNQTFSKHLYISYTPQLVRTLKSVLKAMFYTCHLDPRDADYSLPIPETWVSPVKSEKPILIYRPLVDRKEWGGCQTRNPDKETYRKLFETIRKDFYVVSIADLQQGKEWMVSDPIDADLELHEGQLSFEQMAALFKQARLVYNSPGFATVLSRSVGTPNITVFGGYESSNSFSVGNSPFLPIDIIKPCECFKHGCTCTKEINLSEAFNKIGDFLCRL